MLRVATRAAHDRVDALFSGLDLADPADYRRFLTAQAAAYLPVEEALEARGAGALFPDWQDRRRADRLRADIKTLGLPIPAPIAEPVFETPAEVAGAAYVLEGSRLGGAMLARSVPAGLPHSFLVSPQRGSHWRDFLVQLERLLESPAQREAAVRGAAQTFDHFARAAHHSMDGR
jgi:heme oxygenase (biliverdin-IX-beta and delta-forming)